MCGGAVVPGQRVLCVEVVDGQRTTGETTAWMGRAGRKPKLAPHDAAICVRVAAHPDATLEELQAWLAHEHKCCATNKVIHMAMWPWRHVGLRISRCEAPLR